MIYITFVLIVLLIFTNAITDAPNAISTVVATRVLSFRKAAYISAIFNFLGILSMCFINFSVAKNMVNLISFDGNAGLMSVFSSMISTILFSLVALKYGIPTSETHSLISGLAGAGIALGNLYNMNIGEWIKVLAGLIWSIFFTIIVCKIINFFFRNILKKLSKSIHKRIQIFSCAILSFMHGAQDGLKFIGIFIIYFCSIRNNVIPQLLNPKDYFWIIIFVSSIMSIGVGLGGRNIVNNVGSNITKLNNIDAIITDITTGITLLLASLFGIPVSTSHCKTNSIVAIGEKINHQNVKNIIKTWLITFPVCFLLSYIITKLLILCID